MNAEVKNMIREAFTDFANMALDDGCTTPEEGFEFLCNMNPSIQNDAVTKEQFPTIFMIESCKRKIKSNEGKN